MSSPALLNTVEAIAASAGEAILAVYATDFDVVAKADQSPLTQADLAAHRIIVAALGELEPRLPVLSEEGADIPFRERAGWARYWLVDPLDGTREFVKKNDEFTVNIALIDHGEPVLGVLHAPALAETYAAARGFGAWRVRAGQRRRIRTRAAPQRPVYILSRSHRDADISALLARLPPHEAMASGSARKFGLVAEGAADLYPRTGATSEWDTAAGQCVVEEAGGAVLALAGLAPLRYNTKESLINPGFVVFGDRAFGWPQRLRA